MKKIRIIRLLLICIFLCACNSPETVDSPNGLNWIPEESYFVDYSIEGDRVKFRYLFTYENTTDVDMIIKYPRVTFMRKGLRGWLEYQNGYSGTNEDGTTKIYSSAGEKVSFVLTFEGEYLGGDVNTKIVPSSIIFMQELLFDNDTENTQATS